MFSNAKYYDATDKVRIDVVRNEVNKNENHIYLVKSKSFTLETIEKI